MRLPAIHFRSVFYTAAIFLPILISSCSMMPSAHYTLGPEDSGSTLRLHTGDEFTIVLESNPTTGYLWRFAAPYDELIILLKGDRYISPSEELCGAPGKRSLTFIAQESGRTGLKLIYVRPWEKNQPPEKEFHLMILVYSDEDSDVQKGPRMRRNSKGELVPDRKRSVWE